MRDVDVDLGGGGDNLNPYTGKTPTGGTYIRKSATYDQPFPIVYGTAAAKALPLISGIDSFDHTVALDGGEPKTMRCAYVALALGVGPVAAIESIIYEKRRYAAASGTGVKEYKYLSRMVDGAWLTPPEIFLGDGTTTAWSGFPAPTQWKSMALFRCNFLGVPGGAGRVPELRAVVRGLKATQANNKRNADGLYTRYDAPPGDVIRDLLENAVYGLGLPGGTVVTATGADGNAASSYDRYCAQSGWQIALAIDASISVADVIGQILTATNSVGFWSGANFKIIPLGDTAVGTYTPVLTALAITDDDFVAPEGQDAIRSTRRAWADTYNVVPVEYSQDTALWDSELSQVEAMDAASVASVGVRRSPSTVSLPCIRSKEHAAEISGILARRSCYDRTLFEFVVSARQGAALEPGDLVALTHSSMGLTTRLARVVRVESSPGPGTYRVEAREWTTGASVTVLVTPEGSRGLGNNPVPAADTYGAVAGMASDSVFSVSEHALALTAWNDLTQSGTAVASLDLVVKAAAAGVSSAAFTAAITALGTYLNGGSAWTTGTPSWLTGTVDVAVVPATWQSTWAAAYNQRAALQNALTKLANDSILEMVADGKVTPAEKGALCDALAWIANADANHYSVIKAKLPTGAGTPRQDYEDALAAMSSFLTNFMGGIGLAYYYPTASQAQKDALYAWKQVTTVVMDGSQAGGEAIRFAFAWIYSAQAKVDAAAATSPAVAMTALGAPSVTGITGTPSSATFLNGAGQWATPPTAGAPAWADITGKPTFGTASALNVPAAGNAATGEVVKGSDTRLSDSRPASDVSAWAKAASKPSYTYSEIGSTPASLPASDVYAWAKAATKPTYTAAEVGALASGAKAADSDLLDGQHITYFQPASTAITTSNIGSQSVSYAGTSGSATSAGSISGYGNPTTAATANTIAYRDASGWLYCVDLSTSSDRRGKRKVRNLTGALARVLGLRGVSFFRKGDKTKAQRIGLIAQEAREVVPEVVVEDADGMLSVSYGSLVALLIEALREIVKRLDRLEARR